MVDHPPRISTLSTKKRSKERKPLATGFDAA
jgi:hypothetical protein